MMTTNRTTATGSPLYSNPFVRTIVALIGIVVCVALGWATARAGFSRLLTRYATIVASLPSADQAVRLAPSDPEAHRGRASVLRYLGQLAEAEQECEMAVALRPRDDLLWLDLGTVRDELDDGEGALSALNEAVRAAPYYAHPRWQRGNVLLRQGRYDEAFQDLREAAKSSPDLQLNLVDLAWAISQADPKLTETILQIDSAQMRTAYARFLARKGKGPEAIEQFRKAGMVSEPIRNEMVQQLIAHNAFKEAFEIWASGTASGATLRDQPRFIDGGFEAPLILDEAGFGWRVARGDNALSLSVDATEKQSGSKSLRIQFSGDPNPGNSILSQLVLVEPAKRYRIGFVARTKELTSGALPILMIADPNSHQLLGKSGVIRSGTNDWEEQSVEFTAPPDSTAVAVELRREACSSSPCPIFGFIWLDGFSIQPAAASPGSPSAATKPLSSPLRLGRVVYPRCCTIKICCKQESTHHTSQVGKGGLPPLMHNTQASISEGSHFLGKSVAHQPG